MSDAVTFKSRLPRSRPGPLLGFDLVGLLRWWTARRMARRLRRQVRDLPPYLLDDIGLL